MHLLLAILRAVQALAPVARACSPVSANPQAVARDPAERMSSVLVEGAVCDPASDCTAHAQGPGTPARRNSMRFGLTRAAAVGHTSFRNR